MKKYINIITCCSFLVMGQQVFSQTCSGDDFEGGIPGSYLFTTVNRQASSPGHPALPNYDDCATDVTPAGANNATMVNPLTPSATLNDTNAPVTLVSSGNQTVFGTVTVPRTFGSSTRAVRLNDFDNGNEGNLTTMSKDFTVSSSAVTFRYSVILRYISGGPHTGVANQPFFSARVYSGTTLIDDICVQAHPSNTALTQTLTAPPSTASMFLHSGWTTGTLDVSTLSQGDTATIQFVIGYCSADAHVGVVYIDEVCTVCEATLTETAAISAGSIEAQRSDWINCLNTISSGARGIYHATNFVEMNPGFEAVSGSEFAAYIQGCSDAFAYRPSANQENILSTGDIKTLTIVPNPSNGLVEFHFPKTFSEVKILSIDGKVVFTGNAQRSKEFITDLSSFSNGIYIVNILSDDGQLHSAKLVKN